MPAKGIAATARRVNVARDRWPLLGLVYYWPLKDRAATQLDYYGQAALTCVGEPAFGTGRNDQGSAIEITADEDNAYSSLLWSYPKLNATDWTLNFWLQQGGGEGNTEIFCWDQLGNEESPNLSVIITADNEALQIIADEPGAQGFELPEIELTDWHMFSVVQKREPPFLGYYIDGQFEESRVIVPNYGVQALPIGLGHVPGEPVTHDLGLNDVSLHTKALQTEDIEWLWNGGLGRRYPHY